MFENAAYSHQASPGLQSFHELQSPVIQNLGDSSVPYYPVPLPSNELWSFILFFIVALLHSSKLICCFNFCGKLDSMHHILYSFLQFNLKKFSDISI